MLRSNDISPKNNSIIQLKKACEDINKATIELSQLVEYQQDLEKKYSFLLEENKLLLSQLNIVQNELVYKYCSVSNNTDLKNAEERIKKHLSYRLGNILVMEGKSFIGWIKIPYLLLREIRRFRLDRKN